jgi:hypothetical protein
MRAVALPAAASSGPRPRECAGRRGQASPEHWLLAGPLTVLGWLSSVGGRSVARAGQRADGRRSATSPRNSETRVPGPPEQTRQNVAEVISLPDSGPHITAAQVHIRWIFRQDYRHPSKQRGSAQDPPSQGHGVRKGIPQRDSRDRCPHRTVCDLHG